MIKKIVIAGSRTYHNYEEAKAFLDLCLWEIGQDAKVVILSGGAKGSDAIGERYAAEKGYEVEKHPADWKRYGRAAGPKRNEAMAKSCDAVICFWDGKGKGTRSMIECAKKWKKPVTVKQI